MEFLKENYKLQGEFRSWQTPEFELLRLTGPEEGVEFLKITLTSATPLVPEPFTLRFQFANADTVGRWTAASDLGMKHLPPDWAAAFETDIASNAPVVCFFAADGGNRTAFALSDAKRRLRLCAGVCEDDASIHCRIDFFTRPEAPIERYEVILRVDRRPIPYSEALSGISGWYASLPEFAPPPVPAAAWEPVYSSWYGYHQEIFARELEQECDLARSNLMTGIIVDDGWQTEDTNRGYAYCGDWEISPRRFPDMRSHVKRVQQLGMHYLLWYSVPFIGTKSKNLARFQGKYLRFREDISAWVLDPRFPEVRDFLSGIYERAVREWDIDGFKFDFIDEFSFPGEDPAVRENYAGRDIKSVPEAVDRLLADILARLRALKPEILIEFRQRYFGPSIRKYGNMFRAGDCALDITGNRVRTIDLRLNCGALPVHSDMLCWDVNESAEVAARQILNILFSVPQISVRLAELPESHCRMLRFWLAFWRKNRETLTRGKLIPQGPEWNYPVVTAEDDSCRITVLYLTGQVLKVEAGRKLHIVNASESSRVIIEWTGPVAEAECFNAEGEMTGKRQLSPGLQSVKIPKSGVLSTC